MSILLVLLLLILLIGAGWFFGPQVTDTVKLKRENARVINLTKQTKRDMDNLARRQREDDW